MGTSPTFPPVPPFGTIQFVTSVDGGAGVCWLPRSLQRGKRAILFRNVREMLGNVVQDAQAANVTVILKGVGDRLELVVRDDGVGSDPGQMLTSHGEKAGLAS